VWNDEFIDNNDKNFMPLLTFYHIKVTTEIFREIINYRMISFYMFMIVTMLIFNVIQ
jgi:hypothetical protein